MTVLQPKRFNWIFSNSEKHKSHKSKEFADDTNITIPHPKLHERCLHYLEDKGLKPVNHYTYNKSQQNKCHDFF